MSLIRAGECVKTKKTIEDYEHKKREVLARPLLPTEYRFGSQVICRRCGNEKIFDDRKHFLFVKCSCRCEAEDWEREKNGYSYARQRRVSEIRPGDWNPFDKN